MDLDTFHTMWEMSAPGSPSEHCFLRMTQEEYHREERPQPDVHGLMPDYKEQPREVWPTSAVHGISFTTVTVDTPVYLEYMMDRFINNGGSVIRGTIQHIDQLVEGGEYAVNKEGGGPVPPDAIIVCTGLGARTLGGVEDKDVYPVRGQTVLLRAPWIKFPRPRPEITRDILERVFDLCPELVPPEIRAVREPNVDDLLPIIIEEGCGFRPTRKGGIRIDGEQRGSVAIVHNYGHGGYGYISSWGSATRALAVLERLLEK
ncbi:hypothetical protein DXG01_001835 [Tephrocybe rancida]|nr:hypothetical protein DXG01_001835 [Tephrocybe rancida]